MSFGWTTLVRLAVATVLALAATSGVASAHSAFQDAVPEPGARLQRAPALVVMQFTEPLNARLTEAKIVDVRTGRVAATKLTIRSGRLVLDPLGVLRPAAYRVEWHTVSTSDGHALEGAFGFGVRTDAIGGAQQLQQSPLARDGWLRVALRGLFYGSLLFFAGGLLTSIVLSRTQAPLGWLVPRSVGQEPFAGQDIDRVERRAWRRTIAAGWVATTIGSGVALVETVDAAGRLSFDAVDAYLLSTPSGLARIAAVLALLVAVALGRRHWRMAALASAASLLAVAIGGHANSAAPRLPAVGTDWVHLMAGAIWAGGIAQIAVTWLPVVAALTPVQRRDVLRVVLAGFGRIALPAFVTVVLAGLTNAVIELGRPQSLWETSYGQVLGVKVAIVAVIAGVSYVHAMRLRPRLLAGDAGAQPGRERRHWRLLRTEPVLALLVVSVAALLAVFPLPPRQLLERAEAGTDSAPRAPADGATAATAVRRPASHELAVAEPAGPWITAVWVRRDDRGRLRGTVRLLDLNVKSQRARLRVAGASQHGCGRGCARFSNAPDRPLLTVFARAGAKRYTARVPVRFEEGGSTLARSLLRRGESALDQASGYRISERLSGGPGSLVISDYRVQPPRRFAVTVHSKDVADTIEIGGQVWDRLNGGRWGPPQRVTPLATRRLLPWVGHARDVRLLGTGRLRGRRYADIALTDPGPLARFGTPFWFRLRIDVATGHVTGMRMVAPGHFMRQRYFAYDATPAVRPPVRR